MKVVVILQTPAGRKLRAKSSRGAGDPPTLETYYSPGEEIVLYCSTDEREEVEREAGVRFDSDVLTVKEFGALAQGLRNAPLNYAGVYSVRTPGAV